MSVADACTGDIWSNEYCAEKHYPWAMSHVQVWMKTFSLVGNVVDVEFQHFGCISVVILHTHTHI